jgi:hypothetical protein
MPHRPATGLLSATMQASIHAGVPASSAAPVSARCVTQALLLAQLVYGCKLARKLRLLVDDLELSLRIPGASLPLPGLPRACTAGKRIILTSELLLT